MNQATHKLAQTQSQEFFRIQGLGEGVVATEIRSGNKKFGGCGVMGGITKLEGIATYRVYVTYTYEVGTKAIVAVRNQPFTSLRAALKFLNNAMRFYYAQTISRKIASLLVDGIEQEEAEFIPF